METWMQILTVMGGLEFVKWLVRWFTNRSNDQLILDAEAEKKKYEVLEAHIGFIQDELKEKEERFVEQTTLLRQSQDECFKLKEENAKLRVENAVLGTWKCEVKKCERRMPPNGM